MFMAMVNGKVVKKSKRKQDVEEFAAKRVVTAARNGMCVQVVIVEQVATLTADITALRA